jgi:hypothetical protein
VAVLAHADSTRKLAGSWQWKHLRIFHTSSPFACFKKGSETLVKATESRRRSVSEEDIPSRNVSKILPPPRSYPVLLRVVCVPRFEGLLPLSERTNFPVKSCPVPRFTNLPCTSVFVGSLKPGRACHQVRPQLEASPLFLAQLRIFYLGFVYFVFFHRTGCSASLALTLEMGRLRFLW